MDAVKATPITNWSDLNDALEESLQPHQGERWPVRNYLYRGQEPDRDPDEEKEDEEWGLKSSFHRILPDNLEIGKAYRWEGHATKQFKEAAPLFLRGENLPEQEARDQIWWTFMQHYGASTRLLDWTSSAYVGVYFAVRDLKEADGELWFFDRQKVIQAFIETHGIRDPDQDYRTTDFAKHPPERQTPKVWALFSFWPSPRLQAQQGMFTICDHLRKDHDVAIRQLAEAGGEGDPLQKIRIAKKAKPEILDRLRHHNITALTLSLGADGLGRSIQEQSHLDMELDTGPESGSD